MKLICRTTHNLAEIKVDEIQTTLFRNTPSEVDEMIENLSDVICDLASLLGKEAIIKLKEC